jgi:diguanylate cyclase (GGDEF)-like protein
LKASGDIAYEWDLASDRITWCGDPSRFFGIEQDKVPSSGEGLHHRVNPEDLPRRLRSLSDHFAGAVDYDCEYRVRSANNEFQWIHDRGSAQPSADSAPARLVGMMRVVTSRKKHEAQLEYLANFDDLTGHFNKLRLREALEHALAHAVRFDQPAAFLMVGIDQLGMINTAYGFEAGDAALVEIAHRLDRCLRGSDIIGRPGGDRFGILLSNTPLEDAKATAERILRTLRAARIEIDGERISISASIGIVEFPVQSKTSFDVMAKAESAMLKAKALGRDCVRVFEMTEAERRDYRDSMTIGEEVRQALRDDRLTLAYQPVGNLVPAARFIPVVEQLGLIRAIDRHVLELAFDTLELYPQAELAINISGLTAADRSWLRALTSRLEGRPELARRLMVEITETAALHDIEESARFVSVVRELGSKVALDDFGAGFTTFRHLKALTVDVVKIDGSFVRSIARCGENQVFIRNLVALAKTLDVRTVAECVESLEEAEFLAGQGVDLLQGYYFGRPDTEAPWTARDVRVDSVERSPAPLFGVVGGRSSR